jgi:hypothetical protein
MQMAYLRGRYDQSTGLLHRDFEQVGELLNLWTLGHEVRRNSLTQYETVRTFAENMVEVEPGFDIALERSRPGIASVLLDDSDDARHARVRVNRLDPHRSDSVISGRITFPGISNQTPNDDPGIPNLPAATRLMDAFVCDGRGVSPDTDLNGDGFVDLQDEYLRTYGNAQGYDGRGTPGQININTAPPEVLRALPHWYRLAHQTGRDFDGQWIDDEAAPPRRLVPPRVLLAEAAVQYRDRLNGLDADELVDIGGVSVQVPALATNTGIATLGTPTYSIRGQGLDGNGDGELNDGADTLIDSGLPRGERGFASIGEVLLLNRPGADLFDNAATPTRILEPGNGWRVDFAGRTPYRSDDFLQSGGQILNDTTDGNPTPPVVGGLVRDSSNAVVGGAHVSTDLTDVREFPDNYLSRTIDDRVGGDAEEANLLFAGASNLITTRSDVFTVYFKIRSFKQRPDGVWDATDPESIVDERRYVMLVDRSEVNAPSDRPRILYLEKLPR